MYVERERERIYPGVNKGVTWPSSQTKYGDA